MLKDIEYKNTKEYFAKIQAGEMELTMHLLGKVRSSLKCKLSGTDLRKIDDVLFMLEELC